MTYFREKSSHRALCAFVPKLPRQKSDFPLWGLAFPVNKLVHLRSILLEWYAVRFHNYPSNLPLFLFQSVFPCLYFALLKSGCFLIVPIPSYWIIRCR